MLTSPKDLAAIRREMFMADQQVGKYLKKVGRNGTGCTQGSLYIVRAVDAMPADLPEPLAKTVSDFRQANPSSPPSPSTFSTRAMCRTVSAPSGLKLPRMDETCTFSSPTQNKHFKYTFPHSIFKPGSP
eukprot:TRINITY_DN92098_c0_g1_i1.p1 TRINITY_DN92098_c0_g1~~TRINITY_DN92098_c0_g1_i1.p1  ORF type:complete len:129 (-),score=19.04 TRINITY_DN92098_c0_g1_i1:101-487(-)